CVAPATAGLGATLNWDPGMTATATGGGNGTWDLAATNWFNGASDIAWTDTTGTVDIASFGGSAGSITLGANLGAVGLIFSAPGYTLNGGANTLTVGAGGIDASAAPTGTTTIAAGLSVAADQSWNVAGPATVAVSSSVSGTGNITKTGLGTLTLAGVNGALTGNFIHSAGTLNINNAAALGTGSFSITGTGTSYNSGSQFEPTTFIDNTT